MTAMALPDGRARTVTRQLVGKLEAVALLFQAVALASSAFTDASAYAPGGSTLFYSLATVHLVLAGVVVKVGGPFHHGGLWPAVWLGMAFLMPLVVAHFAGPLRYADNPVCTPMCAYGGPVTMVFAFYPWVAARWRMRLDIAILAALLVEPLVIMLAMKPNPELNNFVSVTLSGTSVALCFALGKAIGYVCRTAARQQVAIEQRKDEEWFNDLHTHVLGCLHAIRAEHGPQAIGIRQLANLEAFVTRRRSQIYLAKADVRVAALLRDHISRFAFAQNTRIRSVPSVGAMTMQSASAKVLDRALGDLLANAVVHAGATDIDIGFTVDAGIATLNVADNGCGFPTATLDNPSTSLYRLRQDLKSLGGSLTVTPLDPGSQVSMSLPLQRRK